MTPIATETTQPAGVSSGAIDFGQLPYLWNIYERSISFWVSPTSDDAANTVVAMVSTDAGFIASTLTSGGTSQVYFSQKGSTTDGQWTSPADSLTLNAWNHVVITRNSFFPATSPVIYINGTSVAITQVAAQVGAIDDETGCSLSLNNYSATDIYKSGLNGKIMDVRLYGGKILTQAQVTELYNAGTLDTACNLDLLPYIQFQAPNIMTTRLAEYTDAVLTDGMNVIDNIYFTIGLPVNTVTGRTT